MFRLRGLGRSVFGAGAGQQRPNKSFKPTPLRGANHMADKACHVLHAPTQRSLTLVLGRMAAILAIVQFALVPLLLLVALSVRFAGASRPLNVVDYALVRDPLALHRWAGNRLLILPVAFLIGGYASYRFPSIALLAFGAATVTCLVTAVWLALGAERFQSAA